MRGYQFRKTREGRVVRRVPCPRCLRAGLSLDRALDWALRSGDYDAARFETLLPKTGSAFRYVQLLSEAAFSWDETYARRICARTCESSRGVRVPADWIC